MTVKLENMGAIIAWKHANQEGMKTSNGEIINFPGGIPSDNDINTWKTEYEAHVAATAYQGKRRDAYAELADQLDMLFHDMTAGKGDKTGDWYAAIAKVKSDNPKPE
tara:strand:+ start:102 stop:422 length:321 start_codon:yes stop_codon:yes gene_type:complete